MRVQRGGSNELEKSYGTTAKDKLDLGPLDKDAKLRRANLRWQTTWHHFGGKFNWFTPKKNGIKREAHVLENQDVS